MTSIHELKAILLDVCQCMPRGPVQQAIHDIDDQIGRLQSMMDGSNDGDIAAAIASLLAVRDTLGGAHVGMNAASNHLENYVGRV